jgi:hypothetical protein
VPVDDLVARESIDEDRTTDIPDHADLTRILANRSAKVMAFAVFSTGERVHRETGIIGDRAGRRDPSTDLYAGNLSGSADPSVGRTWDLRG